MSLTAADLRPGTYVCIDDFGADARYLSPDRWNGFACPYFDRENVTKLIALADPEQGWHRLYWDGDDVVEVYPEDESEPDEEYTVRYEPILVDGEPTWGIGAYAWTWFECGEEA